MRFTTSSMLWLRLHDPCNIPGKGCFRHEPLKGARGAKAVRNAQAGRPEKCRDVISAQIAHARCGRQVLHTALETLGLRCSHMDVLVLTKKLDQATHASYILAYIIIYHM